jgi:hypothetical protein
MKHLLLVFCLLFPLTCSYASEHIVFYRFGDRDPAAWSLLKKHFGTKGYSVSIYEGSNILEKHIENVNRMNREKAMLLVALDFSFGPTDRVFVAAAEAKRRTGNIPAIEEVPARHAVESKECAKMVAASFHRGFVEVPLFPLLGVDMPAIFMRLECTKEKTLEIFDTLTAGLQQYFGRGTTNEK